MIFAGLYLAVRALAQGLPRQALRSFPSNAALALAALATGAAAFLLRLVWPTGTTLLHLQLGYFASYVVLFAAGCLAAPWTSLDEAPARQRGLWITIACVTFPLLPIAVVVGAHIPWLAGSLSGGWNFQAAVYAFWEPFLAWGVIMGLLHLYTRRLEAPGRVGGRCRVGPILSTSSICPCWSVSRSAGGPSWRRRRLTPCDGDCDLPCVRSAGGLCSHLGRSGFYRVRGRMDGSRFAPYPERR